MERVASAISAYHRILDQPPFRDLEWAEALQSRMRQHRIADSGRLLCPVLRPCLLSTAQAANLAATATGLAKLLRRLEPIIATSPQLLNRIRMLPGENMLASLACESSFISRPLATVTDDSVCIHGFHPSTGIGLAFARLLADMFLPLPITADLARAGFKTNPLSSPEAIASALLELAGLKPGIARPRIAILDLHSASPSRAESDLLAAALNSAGLCARVVNPEQLHISGNRLLAEGIAIDAFLRRIPTATLLATLDNDHPFWTAYRNRLAHFVNGFRSDLWQYPASLELLTDAGAWQSFSSTELALVANGVSWTRLVYNRKTAYCGAPVDLIPFVRQNRAGFTLRPNNPDPDAKTYLGAQLSSTEWDRALKLAETTPFVAQSTHPPFPEFFPILRYGELTHEPLVPSICCNVVNGSLESAAAILHNSAGQQAALAPVLVLQPSR